AKIKKINSKLGAPSDKKKNPFLKPGGGIDLIEKFPVYENKKPEKLIRKQKDIIRRKSGRLRW
ncbi:unnamed protein product, partial [marine sediment metagenome]